MIVEHLKETGGSVICLLQSPTIDLHHRCTELSWQVGSHNYPPGQAHRLMLPHLHHRLHSLLLVLLGVDLGGDRRTVAEDDAGSADASLLREWFWYS